MKHFCLTITLTVLAASVAASADDVDEVRRLRAENRLLQTKVERQAEQIDELKDQIKTLRAEPAQQKIAELQGRLDEKENQLAEAKKKIKEMAETVKQMAEKCGPGMFLNAGEEVTKGAKVTKIDNEAEEAKIDKEKFAAFETRYNQYFHNLSKKLAANRGEGNFFTESKTRNDLINDYTQCIAATKKLVIITKDVKATDGETWMKLSGMYTALLRKNVKRGAPGGLATYKHTSENYQPNHTRSVETLAKNILRELKEQRKMISSIPVTDFTGGRRGKR